MIPDNSAFLSPYLGSVINYRPGGGGEFKFYPIKKGGGAEEVLVMLKGNTKRVFRTQELDVLAMLKGGGGGGAQRVVLKVSYMRSNTLY